MTTQPPVEDFVSVAEVEIEAVQPSRSGFVLSGRGRDSAEYRLEMELELPVDLRTRRVVGELLSQSRCRLWRRAPRSLHAKQARPRRPVGP
jgi:hypothetical protein